ncbi:DUF2079 domain-containing protein [Myxococcaceae bacterium JPH2]|nr:DUF2079 domain-containing protein [Myxococcaceae bacterium JPH2]
MRVPMDLPPTVLAPTEVPSEHALRRASWGFAVYAMALCGLAVASGPLSWVHRELGAVRSWQLLLHPLLVLWLWRSGAFPVLERVSLGRRLKVALALCSLGWCLLLQLWRYHAFSVNGVDFSIFDWMLYSTNHGRFMYSPIYDVNHFGVHPSYVMLPLVPLHRLFESPLLLVGITALGVWGAVLPLWKLATRAGRGEALALLLCVAYLTSPWSNRLLDGGFRPEVLYPLCGLMLAWGWVEHRAALWAPALVAFLAIKEDAALHASALALGALLFERSRRREALGVLGVCVALFILNTTVVQPWALAQTGKVRPGYLDFWGQHGSSLGAIALHMLSSPWTVVSDIFRSGWYRLFLPALFLPLLSRQPLVAMLPSLFLLGSASNPTMHEYRLYYPVTLLPFFLWGLLEARERLGQWGWSEGRRTALFAVAALSFPLWGDGYARLWPLALETRAVVRATAVELGTPTGPVCAQTVLFPHLPYALAPRPLFDLACARTPGAVVLVHPELDPWPHSKEALTALVAEATARGEAEPRGEGLVLLRPR